MNKRTIIRISSYAVTFVLVLGIFAYSNYNQAKYYKNELENNYEQSLIELSEYMTTIENTLGKGIYAATDTMVADLSTNLWRETTGAKSAISKLPLKDLNLQGTYKFLSQVGDFAITLNKKLASGGEITKEEHQNLVKLNEYAKNISKTVADMANFYSNSEKIVNDVNGLTIDTSAVSVGLKNGFTSTEDSLTDYPSLIYDGPFSDHLLNQTPQYTKNKDKISRSDAQKIAENIKGIKTDALSYEGMENSNLPCYTFNSKDKTIAITEKGGYLCYIIHNMQVKKSSIEFNEALDTAKQFLINNGYENMEITYYAINNNVCVMNFAYKQNDVICYTDLIKVGVSMDDGTIKSFDARGFISNHKDRDIAKPQSTKDACQEKLSSYLEVLSSKVALIPTDYGTEVLCYEFHCRSTITGEELLVYVDCKTLKETDILFMLYTDNGIFVR